MPQYLSPGVYVEEVDSGSRPIEGVGTAVAAFVGLATQGPFNTPTLVSNWTQFTATFGDFAPAPTWPTPSTATSMNGGGNCYVVRIGDDGERPATATAAPARSPPAPQAQLGPADASSRWTPAPRPGEHQRRGRRRRRRRRRPTTCSSWSSSAAGRSSRSSTALTPGRGKQNVATMVNAASKLIQHRGRRHRRRREAGHRATVTLCRAAAAGRRAVARARPPTTTSATSPTAPASAASRPSTRSPWSASPT